MALRSQADYILPEMVDYVQAARSRRAWRLTDKGLDLARELGAPAEVLADWGTSRVAAAYERTLRSVAPAGPRPTWREVAVGVLLAELGQGPAARAILRAARDAAAPPLAERIEELRRRIRELVLGPAAPGFTDGVFCSVVAFVARGRYGRAIELLRRLPPDFDDRTTAMIDDLRLARRGRRRRLRGPARQDFDEALEAICRACDEDRCALVIEIAEGIPADERPAPFEEMYAQSLSGAGRFREARRAFRRTLRKCRPDDRARAYFRLCGLALERGRSVEAEGWGERAVTAGPDDWSNYVNAGLAVVQRGDPWRAATIFRRGAVVRDPDPSEAALNLALVMRRFRLYRSAVRLCERALATDPDYGYAQRTLADCRLAARIVAGKGES